MESWLKNAAERQKLAAKLHATYRHEKHREAKENLEKERERIDYTWKAACDEASETGCVNLCWLDLKHISERIFTFESDHNQKLLDLRLNGIGLRDLEEIPTRCSNLLKLSVASNAINDVSNIHLCTELTHLNLMRNNLKALPATIERLTNLIRLEVANNSLTMLPPEISNLRLLKTLNLECNQLTELPVEFGRLDCRSLNLSNNKFTVFPSCIVDMRNLRRLSINYNEIGVLPGFHKLKKLEILHAGKNRVTILPDSFVDMTSLRSLWLDFNQLSGLPPNFHRLTRLSELKLEGNPNLIYPPIELVGQGVEEVLRWSRQRLERSNAKKTRIIIQSLGEVLKQVHQYEIGGSLHESLFEVVGEDYQFPPDALWNVFLPELAKMWSDPERPFNEGINSFPFERTEVEQSMLQFRDACGAIIRKTAHGRFRKCSCVETRGTPAACVPPKTGWICTRPALLMRKMVYEEDMREKKRILAEANSIAEAERAAKKEANTYLASNEGILNIRNEAIKRVASKHSPQKSTINIVLKRIPMPTIIKRAFETNLKLRRAEDEIKEIYQREKMAEARNRVIYRNKQIATVMQSWMGLSLFDSFDSWRYVVEKANSQRRREERRHLQEERLWYEDELAKYEYLKIDHSHWTESWDEYNDCTVWVHSQSKETLYQEPVLPPPPPLPSSLINPLTGEMLTKNDIQQNEADTISVFSLDSSSANDNSEEPRNNDDATSEINLGGAPRGPESEVELAKMRVIERQKQHIRATSKT